MKYWKNVLKRLVGHRGKILRTVNLLKVLHPVKVHLRHRHKNDPLVRVDHQVWRPHHLPTNLSYNQPNVVIPDVWQNRKNSIKNYWRNGWVEKNVEPKKRKKRKLGKS